MKTIIFIVGMFIAECINYEYMNSIWADDIVLFVIIFSICFITDTINFIVNLNNSNIINK